MNYINANLGTIYYIDTIPYISITIENRTIQRRAYDVTEHTAIIRYKKKWCMVKHW